MQRRFDDRPIAHLHVLPHHVLDQMPLYVEARLCFDVHLQLVDRADDFVGLILTRYVSLNLSANVKFVILNVN